MKYNFKNIMVDGICYLEAREVLRMLDNVVKKFHLEQYAPAVSDLRGHVDAREYWHKYIASGKFFKKEKRSKA